MIWHILECFLFLFPVQGTQETFYLIFCEDLVKLLEIKAHKCEVPPMTSSPGDFNSQSCPSLLPTIHQVQFRISYPGTGSCRGYFGKL